MTESQYTKIFVTKDFKRVFYIINFDDFLTAKEKKD